MAKAVEVAVVGGGPAGLTAAIALAEARVETVLISKRSTQEDHRTTALLRGSVTALDTLGVWARCHTQAAPLRTMRIVDDTGRLLRSPEIKFEASEIDLDAFGYNIENRHLLAALETRVGELRGIWRIEDEAGAVNISDNSVSITLEDGSEIEVRLVVGADGRRSICRAAAGIETDRRSYPQVALTFNLGHTRPHRDISTEFHTPGGPFTLVPLPGRRSSLVYVTDPPTADRLNRLNDVALSEELERRAHSILGKFTIEPGRGVFPLAMETARSLGARRVALIGEAAHVLPPIGAQGLNLGLRDAATIAEVVANARRTGADLGAPEVLARYDKLRQSDVGSRTLAVDLLNRTLLSDFLPLQGARQLSFLLLDRLGPLRRAVMREGIAPTGSQPRLMRGEALSSH
ncbi:MAG: 2-octaprenyl-6-methoxyphenol hydroxylase [Alphaproteobacteria bacterium]|jgi:2-octaprenyl-6-methoxyphenol hydroxylase|nr:2-octaprenyl-6-methoxyphenol hydroxylase [Alphaproteobacteria bacterium]